MLSRIFERISELSFEKVDSEATNSTEYDFQFHKIRFCEYEYISICEIKLKYAL